MFRFEKIWLNKEECAKMVSHVWGKSSVRTIHKLASLSRVLGDWVELTLVTYRGRLRNKRRLLLLIAKCTVRTGGQ